MGGIPSETEPLSSGRLGLWNINYNVDGSSCVWVIVNTDKNKSLSLAKERKKKMPYISMSFDLMSEKTCPSYRLRTDFISLWLQTLCWRLS